MLFLIITILNSITTTPSNNQIASFLFLMYSHKIYEKSMKKSTNSENEKKKHASILSVHTFKKLLCT
jgi:hypothetical protein